MADELQSNLATYRLQLQQVEASLANDADNEDLLKLKKDLQEVIDLTSELVGQQKVEVGDEEEEAAGPSNEETGSKVVVPQHDWKSGEDCMAMYSEDGQYYPATVDEVLEDGTCTVKFNDYGNMDVTEVKFLKSTDPESYTTGEAGQTDAKKPQSKKDLIASQREYKRKKSQKKAQRLKQMEEERESEKNKWLDFNSKTFSKTSKGKVKKSIFATTEHVNGRVGVGTCGVSGRPMTSFTQQEKWKK
ncbi:survival of motor neuron-related-splicing factor 30-like [Mizuhopecten yessoensis]|uniref:Survival of motor neuron-related-splicing factor 30 n=1 Tax=Mizuhopecten yessoensis TaxID=6573 RepID=A0A210QZS8_MIZYE|nr:survival of motor neuron-related-splicing factor 30-like [Mizuhopecten yessoensis]OWF54268.1 Survival of motor neuron-related-splicing factor 30 [Mizuhopecten yessoensis]